MINQCPASLSAHLHNKAGTRGNGSYQIFRQRRLRSDCAVAQSDLSLHCQHYKIAGFHMMYQRTENTLIRVRGCASSSWPLLFAYDPFLWSDMLLLALLIVAIDKLFAK